MQSPHKDKGKVRVKSMDEKKQSDPNKASVQNRPDTSHNEALKQQRVRRRSVLLALFFMIVFLSGIAVWYVWQDRQTSDSITQPVLIDAEPVQASVDVTADGFSPATLVLPLRSAVTITNKHTQEASIESSNIDGFLEPIVLAQGDTLSYTFDTPGTYSFTESTTKHELVVIVE